MTLDHPTVLTLLDDSAVSAGVDRVAAAVGLRVVHAASPSRRIWSSPVAVILDQGAARRCVSAGMPRRDGVVLVASGEPTRQSWSDAIAVGAQHVCTLPEQETELVGVLSRWSDSDSRARGGPCSGRVIAVTGGRGGAGASVFAVALALCSGGALLVDLDGCGGGIDLLLGGESDAGVRWPDLSLRAGRLGWAAIREALPHRSGVSVLSAARDFCDIDAGAALAVIDAGRRGGTTVVCDVPRQPSPAGAAALEAADLVVVVASCDVRCIASTAATVGVVRALNRNLGLVVRGPSPGGLHAEAVGEVVSTPLLAAMRPEPMLAQRLEQDGLRLRRRSPLAAAARTVLGLMDRHAVAAA